MRKYIKYQAKKSINSTIILALVGIIIYASMISINGLVPHSYNNPYYNGIYLPSLGLYFMAYFLVALTILIPIMQTSYLKDKRLSDLYLSFPINRVKLLLTNLLIGFIQIIVIFTAVFWIGFIIALLAYLPNADIITKHNLIFNTNFKGYDFIQYIPLYFISIGLSIIPYVIHSFIYLKANSRKDGLLLIGLYTMIPILFSSINISLENQHWSIVYHFSSPLTTITTGFSSLIERRLQIPMSTYLINIKFYVSLAIFLAIAIVSGILIYKEEKMRKTENIEQITNSYYGYKTILPIVITLTFASSSIGSRLYMNVLLVIIALGYLALYMIYQRTIKLKYTHYIIWISCILLGTGLGQLLYQLT